MLSCEVHETDRDARLDVFLRGVAADLSRSRIQALIRSGHVKVNDCTSRPGHRLKVGDQVLLAVPPPEQTNLEPGDVEFQVIHEDSALIVVSKPAGLVVHPAPGHATGTLVHGLLKHCKDLSGIGGELRPGIVHRLDKDTSGLMVAAKNDNSHAYLVEQFKSGSVHKQYLALVHGHMNHKEGRIDLPLGRHPFRRKEIAVLKTGGRHAVTIWERRLQFDTGFSLLSISLKTGRTHQIRVHLSHIGHPVVGDPVYGYRRAGWKRRFASKEGPMADINRQMLHATCLGFCHPISRSYVEFEAPLPEDMKQVLAYLEASEPS